MAVAVLLGGSAWPAVATDNIEDKRALRRTPVVEAYERARDSVVNISAVGTVEVQRFGVNIFGDLFPVPMTRQERSVGSGFVLHADGYIGTNAHAVSAGAQLSVTLANGTEYEARVIGRDIARDLAVIKIDPTSPLRPIQLGRSSDLMIGEPTIAVGNPVGLQNTVTTGVVSAINRELAVEGRVIYPDVIQTDASINPGNSGGPLLNILGEMIGVNTAIRTDVQNIGFAIPVDHLREILPQVLDCEKLNQKIIGMHVNGDPVHVTEVSSGGPADEAGVRVGDQLLEIDGRPVSNFLDFYVSVLERRGDDSLRLKLGRDGRTFSITVKLEGVPKPDSQELALKRLGVRVSDVREDVARRFMLRRQGGVIVLAVEPGSPADQAGLKPGDLLVSIGPNWLQNVEQMGAVLSAVRPSEPVQLGFRREHRGRLYDWEGRIYVR